MEEDNIGWGWALAAFILVAGGLIAFITYRQNKKNETVKT